MSNEGSITPADLVVKLEYLAVVCEKCGRRGRYSVTRLVEQLGPNAKLTDWRVSITADCPRRIVANYNDQCGACCPDLVGAVL
jgi:hypothetical protein